MRFMNFFIIQISFFHFSTLNKKYLIKAIFSFPLHFFIKKFAYLKTLIPIIEFILTFCLLL